MFYTLVALLSEKFLRAFILSKSFLKLLTTEFYEKFTSLVKKSLVPEMFELLEFQTLKK